MELTQQQQTVFDKIKEFMNSDASVFILRGYAGTGKTTMVKVIADYLAQSRSVHLMAPTGRAARVLFQKTGHMAYTIHKSIYAKACVLSKKVTITLKTGTQRISAEAESVKPARGEAFSQKGLTGFFYFPFRITNRSNSRSRAGRSVSTRITETEAPRASREPMLEM